MSTLSRRDTLRFASALAATTAGLSATVPQDAAAEDDPGDYELTITINYDFQDRSTTRVDGKTPATYGQFVIEAGRTDGAYRMRTRQVLATDPVEGDDLMGPALVDVRDQTEGADAVALLQLLLGGHAVFDGYKVVRLPDDELAEIPMS